MDNPHRSFTDLFTSWTKAQEQAWQFQSKMFEEANASFTKAVQGASAEGVGNDSGSPFDEVWSQSQEAFQNWRQYCEGVLPAGGEAGIGAEMLHNLLDPGSWLNFGINELNQTIVSLAEGAQFANIWDAEQQALRASKEWLELRRHSLRYRYIIMEAWMRAFDRLSEVFNKELEGGEPTSSAFWQKLLGSWLDIANQELLKTQRSDEFLAAQRDLLRAGIDFRKCQQEFVEKYCEAQAIPTRTEVDDLHRTVTELRREVRALKLRLVQEEVKPATASGRKRAAKGPGQSPAKAKRTKPASPKAAKR